MDELNWWVMLGSVDEIGMIVGNGIRKVWCRELEDKVHPSLPISPLTNSGIFFSLYSRLDASPFSRAPCHHRQIISQRHYHHHFCKTAFRKYPHHHLTISNPSLSPVHSEPAKISSLITPPRAFISRRRMLLSVCWQVF